MTRTRIPSFVTHWSTDLRRPLYGVKNRLQDWVLKARVRSSDAIWHVHGPQEVPGDERDLVVLCLVRDGALWVDAYIEHHLSLGAGHVVFLDNGSTDATIERASRYDRVSIWATDLPFRVYENSFRRWLSANFGYGRWALHADIDEMFDYPGSARLALREFLAYLDYHGYAAVLAHMVDMFSDRPIRDMTDAPGDPVAEKYRYYDLRGIEKRRDIYWIRDQRVQDESIFCTFDGVRGRVFGSQGLLQSKHPLVRLGPGVRVYPYDGHFATGARVADVTAALLHYKFLSALPEQAEQAVEEGQFLGHTRNYEKITAAFERDLDLSLHSAEARELESVDQLVEEGLLSISEPYRRWIDEHGSGPAGG